MLTDCDLLIQHVMIPKGKPEKKERFYGGARPNWHCKVSGVDVILPYGNGCKLYHACLPDDKTGEKGCPFPDCRCNE